MEFIVTMVLTCIYYPIILIVFLPFCLVMVLISLKFRGIMNYVKIANSKSKSPVFSEINSTMNALTLIRAFEKGDYIKS